MPSEADASPPSPGAKPSLPPGQLCPAAKRCVRTGREHRRHGGENVRAANASQDRTPSFDRADARGPAAPPGAVCVLRGTRFAVARGLARNRRPSTAAAHGLMRVRPQPAKPMGITCHPMPARASEAVGRDQCVECMDRCPGRRLTMDFGIAVGCRGIEGKNATVQVPHRTSSPRHRGVRRGGGAPA